MTENVSLAEISIPSKKEEEERDSEWRAAHPEELADRRRRLSKTSIGLSAVLDWGAPVSAERDAIRAAVLSVGLRGEHTPTDKTYSGFGAGVDITRAACAFARAADSRAFQRGTHLEAWALACQAMAIADGIDPPADVPAYATLPSPRGVPRVRWGRLRPAERAQHVRRLAALWARGDNTDPVDKILALGEDILWPTGPLSWGAQRGLIGDLAIASGGGTARHMGWSKYHVAPDALGVPGWSIDFEEEAEASDELRLAETLAGLGLVWRGGHHGGRWDEHARAIAAAWRDVGAVEPVEVEPGTLLDLDDPRTPGAVRTIGGCTDARFTPPGAGEEAGWSRYTAFGGREVDVHLWSERARAIALRLRARADGELVRKLATLGVSTNQTHGVNEQLARAVRVGWGVE